MASCCLYIYTFEKYFENLHMIFLQAAKSTCRECGDLMADRRILFLETGASFNYVAKGKNAHRCLRVGLLTI